MAFDWDDLKVFITAAHGRSFARAAEVLGVDATTVRRRIERLESALKCTLLIRAPTGLQLTAAGGHLLDRSTAVETAMAAVASIGEGDLVGGSVRLSASEGFGVAILSPALPRLRQLRPGLRIELAASSSGFLSPTRREVDMAVTLSAPEDARLSVEPLTDYQLGLYASEAYLARTGAPVSVADLAGHQMVGYVDDLIYASELKYMDEVAPGLRPGLASSSIRAQREIIAADGGIGVLPCFLADGLAPVLPESVMLTRRFWLSTHLDVSGTARVRAVRRWLIDLVKARHADLSPH